MIICIKQKIILKFHCNTKLTFVLLRYFFGEATPAKLPLIKVYDIHFSLYIYKKTLFHLTPPQLTLTLRPHSIMPMLHINKLINT
jgi:hypothetical protein